MREMERLVGGMQRHWLLRKYVNKTNPPPQSVDYNSSAEKNR